MPIYEFRTWKSSTLYGVDDFWCNRWFISVPYEVDVNTDGGPGMAAAICEIEAQIHQDHVHYSHVTMLHADLLTTAGPPDVTTFRNYIYTRRGFRGTPANPAPFYMVRKCAKYVNPGRMGYWWFRGCIDMDQVALSPGRTLIDKQRNDFDAVVAVWPGVMSYYHSATILVPNGINRYGHATSYAPVNRIMAMGVTHAHRQQRKDPLKHGTGSGIQTNLARQIEFITDWDWQLFANTYYLPADYYTGQWIDYTVTLLSNLKSLMNTISSYADSVSGGGGGTGGAGFRWEPDAETVATLATAETTAIDNDIDAVNHISYTRNPDGSQTVPNAAMHQMDDIFKRHRSTAAVLARADWLNPANAGS